MMEGVSLRLLGLLVELEPRGRADLARALGVDRKAVSKAVVRLTRKEFVRRQGQSLVWLTPAGRQALAAGTVTVRRPYPAFRATGNPFRQRAWAAMRVRRAFTAAEIVSDAEDGREGNALDRVRRLVALLRQAGYLRDLPAPHGPRRYLLTRNTGPLVPRFREDGGWVDPNTGEEGPHA